MISIIFTSLSDTGRKIGEIYSKVQRPALGYKRLHDIKVVCFQIICCAGSLFLYLSVTIAMLEGQAGILSQKQKDMYLWNICLVQEVVLEPQGLYLQGSKPFFLMGFILKFMPMGLQP